MQIKLYVLKGDIYFKLQASRFDTKHINKFIGKPFIISCGFHWYCFEQNSKIYQKSGSKRHSLEYFFCRKISFLWLFKIWIFFLLSSYRKFPWQHHQLLATPPQHFLICLLPYGMHLLPFIELTLFIFYIILHRENFYTYKSEY